MIETKTYNVIWIDDKCDEIDLPGNAEQENIIIKPYKYGKDGISELKAHIENWDGVIVDVKCLWASDDEVDRIESFHQIKEDLLTLKSKRPIPFFVYSGQPDVQSDDSFKMSLNGRKLYKKNLDEEELLKDIKIEADKLPEVQIRHKYLDVVGEMPSEIVHKMTSVLLKVENDNSSETNVFPEMRNVINWIMKELNEYGLLVVKFDHSNIGACSAYLEKEELSKYVPIHIQRYFRSCVDICNNGTHWDLPIDNLVKEGKAPFLIRATAFELLNILYWYHSLSRDEDYINEMKQYVSKVMPDNVIDGVLEQDESGNYHCGDILVGHTSVKQLDLHEGDKIRVTKTKENTKIKLNGKYPRFASGVEKIEK